MLMVHLPCKDIHTILGQGWLLSHKAVISYADKCLMFFAGGKRCKRKCSPDAPALLPLSEKCPALLTCMQLRRLAEDKGNRLFLAHVSVVDKTLEETLEEGELPANTVSASASGSLGVVAPVPESIVHEYADAFADMPPRLPPDRGVKHTINTENAKPISKPMYRLSPKETDEVSRQVKVLLDKGLIQPSRSAWSSPVIFVSKPDGSLRMCIDYRASGSV